MLEQDIIKLYKVHFKIELIGVELYDRRQPKVKGLILITLVLPLERPNFIFYLLFKSVSDG